MKVRLKKLNENVELPKKGHEGDFCYDVKAISEEEVAPNVWKYGLGFAYEIDRDKLKKMVFLDDSQEEGMLELTELKKQEYNISIDFRPRSSVWKTGMSLSNATGTLDEFYRGEAMAVFYHIFPDMPRYKVGDKIGQIKLGLTLPMEFEFVDDINKDTERGEGGFGSTGLQ